MTFSAGRKQGSCIIYLGKGQDHYSFRAGELIFMVSFTTYNICAQTTANFTRGPLLTEQSLFIPTKIYPPAQSWQDTFPLLHSLQHIHLCMRPSAPHQGKVQPSLALAVAPKKHAARKRISFCMFVVWANSLPLQLQQLFTCSHLSLVIFSPCVC